MCTFNCALSKEMRQPRRRGDAKLPRGGVEGGEILGAEALQIHLRMGLVRVDLGELI
ncbi:hypothetical protein D3C85_1920550 [compost metagenome]